MAVIHPLVDWLPTMDVEPLTSHYEPVLEEPEDDEETPFGSSSRGAPGDYSTLLSDLRSTFLTSPSGRHH